MANYRMLTCSKRSLVTQQNVSVVAKQNRRKKRHQPKSASVESASVEYSADFYPTVNLDDESVGVGDFVKHVNIGMDVSAVIESSPHDMLKFMPQGVDVLSCGCLVNDKCTFFHAQKLPPNIIKIWCHDCHMTKGGFPDSTHVSDVGPS